MYNRYLALKKFYPDSVILIYHHDKYKTYGDDKLIYDYLDNSNLARLNINYIILNNLDIDYMQEYDHNNYHNILLKAKLIEIIKYMYSRIEVKL